jgi:hypothetical protein
MPVLEKVLWRFFGPRLAPTHTGSHAGEQVKRNSRIGIGVSIHGLEPYTPNRSVTALGSSFLVFSLVFGKREDGCVWSG